MHSSSVVGTTDWKKLEMALHDQNTKKKRKSHTCQKSRFEKISLKLYVAGVANTILHIYNKTDFS